MVDCLDPNAVCLSLPAPFQIKVMITGPLRPLVAKQSGPILMVVLFWVALCKCLVFRGHTASRVRGTFFGYFFKFFYIYFFQQKMYLVVDSKVSFYLQHIRV